MKATKTTNVNRYCDKSFTGAQNLQIHMNTVHEYHKDYKCESCGKLFSYAHSLKNHIHTVHEGHKDYKCESCGKSFSEAGHTELKYSIAGVEFQATKQFILSSFCMKLYLSRLVGERLIGLSVNRPINR